MVFNKEGDTLTHRKNFYEFTDFSENTGFRFFGSRYNNVDSERSKYIGQQVYDPNKSYNSDLGTFYYLTEYLGTSKLIRSEEKVFSYDNIVRTVKTKRNFEYNSNDLPVYTETEFPDQNIMIETKAYATEAQDNALTAANMIAIPLVSETKTNGKTISKTETVYDNLLPKYIYSYPLGMGQRTEEVRFDSYDNRGNLLQYTIKPDVSGNGGSVVIIWGYNNTVPIAKIEGATYDQVSPHIAAIVSKSDLDNTQGTSASEQDLITALDLFRKIPQLSGYQITTYTYDPLIGVRSVTPPSGIREHYIYDSANRLEKVVDINGKILKEYEYNYRN